MTTPPVLVIATTNPGKVDEIRDLLDGRPLMLRSLAEFPDMPPIVEDGATFMDNALIKAHAVARATGYAALADDSGLVVDALGGEPGVHSARFAPTPDACIDKLLGLLEGIPSEKRTARFVCALAVVSPEGEEWTATGACEGLIIGARSGKGGFGYDPVFLYPPLGKTFAELPREEKNRFSHRGQALARFLDDFDANRIDPLRER